MYKALIFSAPSGSGKTTIVKSLLERISGLEFSISATSRASRGDEKDGRDYYFMSGEEFMLRVEEGEFLEWEEVYSGIYYGTLRAEIKRIWDREHTVIFDIDVMGGMNLKKLFGDDALSIFVMPPSLEALRKRLISRGTDSPEAIEKRMAKAATELEVADSFDKVIINDSLEEAVSETEKVIINFLKK